MREPGQCPGCDQLDCPRTGNTLHGYRKPDKRYWYREQHECLMCDSRWVEAYFYDPDEMSHWHQPDD